MVPPGVLLLLGVCRGILGDLVAPPGVLLHLGVFRGILGDLVALLKFLRGARGRKLLGAIPEVEEIGGNNLQEENNLVNLIFLAVILKNISCYYLISIFDLNLVC